MSRDLTIDRRVRAEAADWVAALHASLPSSPSEAREYESNCRKFIEWVSQSADHVAAFLHADDTFCRLSGSPGMKRVNLEKLQTHYRQHPRLPLGIASVRGSWRTFRLRRRAAIGLAASVLLVSAAAMVFQMMSPSHEYATAVGEQLNVKLPDGSLMLLNTKSRARFDFSKEHRFVYLNSGEALFDVERDARRPFIVITPTARVRAVGTRFNVYEHPAPFSPQSNATTVSVLEGVVQIAQADTAGEVLARRPLEPGVETTDPKDQPSANERLAAGEQANISRRGVTRSAKSDVSDAVAWRDRVLVFQGTPIADVAAEYNRYNTSQVLLDDPDIEQLQMSGTYSADRPQNLVSYLEEAFPVLVTRQGNNWIITKR